ncbi:hypothetical protein KQX54_013655 [Cotesia glomerata]|uniref:Uncharacterized protein n=1 Tax=Cotesia glomerata TaxID=32391 RepID=A0AAV7IZ02_COTGL|nr:hypothetical protein KQX54_013655 [Cotesia glomerata]
MDSQCTTSSYNHSDNYYFNLDNYYAKIGDYVLLAVPKVDRSPSDTQNIVCVITDQKGEPLCVTDQPLDDLAAVHELSRNG